MKFAVLFFVLIALGLAWLVLYNKDALWNVEYSATTSYTSDKKDSWRLFLFAGDAPDMNYKFDDVAGFVIKENCIAEGESRTQRSGSFLCGFNCETQQATIGDTKTEGRTCQAYCTATECSNDDFVK